MVPSNSSGEVAVVGFLQFTKTFFTGKTFRWSVQNKSNQEYLGEIRFFAPWRKYVFAPIPSTLFDAACLSDIHNFINQAMTARRNARV